MFLFNIVFKSKRKTSVVIVLGSGGKPWYGCTCVATNFLTKFRNSTNVSPYTIGCASLFIFSCSSSVIKDFGSVKLNVCSPSWLIKFNLFARWIR